MVSGEAGKMVRGSEKAGKDGKRRGENKECKVRTRGRNKDMKRRRGG